MWVSVRFHKFHSLVVGFRVSQALMTFNGEQKSGLNLQGNYLEIIDLKQFSQSFEMCA